jgi:hypothetical protein
MPSDSRPVAHIAALGAALFVVFLRGIVVRYHMVNVLV